MSNTAHAIKTSPIRQMIKETCTRCCGSGNTGHRRCNGVCFCCGGNGFTVTEAVFSVVAVEMEPADPIPAFQIPSGDNWLSELFNA